MRTLLLWMSAVAFLWGQCAPAYAQEAPPEAEPAEVRQAEPASPETPGEPEQPVPSDETAAEPASDEATPPQVEELPIPNLSRSSWIVLIAILGEQLPEGVVLSEVSLLTPDVDARIHVLLPRANSGPLQAQLMENLQRYFAEVEAQPFSGPGNALYLEGDIAITGVPTLSVYRQRKSAAARPVGEPQAQRPEPPAPQVAWPQTELRQVFSHGANNGLVAQLVLHGNEYIVREGRAFANNQYRFVGMAPSPEDAPDRRCVIIERIATGDTSTFCVEPQP